LDARLGDFQLAQVVGTVNSGTIENWFWVVWQVNLLPGFVNQYGNVLFVVRKILQNN
jgi:hypothetical protein